MIRIGLVSVILLLVGVGASNAQDPVDRPLFTDDSTLELTIEGPIRQLRRDGAERPERDGLVRYLDAEGQELVLDVAIRVRGNTRLDFCSFPPLRLNFRRRQLEGTVFTGQNQLKLVTVCRRERPYRDYIAQEYQIYRAYNALTDRSFRVRWANIEYVDTERRRRSFSEPAFLIEEDWEVAERLGMETLEVESLTASELDPRATALVSLFQFMIGNTDWSGTSGRPGDDCCHNGKVLGAPNSSVGRVLLPYDFDYAGLISTEYAQPNEGLSISSVRERLYRGYCATNAELAWAVTRMNEQRDRVQEAFDADPATTGARRRALRYLNESYEIINDAELRASQIIEACRG